MDQRSAASQWPKPPELPLPTIMDQRWRNAIFLHWPIPEPEAARFMPAGIAPATTGDDAHGYSVRRFRQGARSGFSVVPHPDAAADGPLSVHLTARFGTHGTFRGRTIYIPNSHEPWPLYAAELHDLHDGLVEAAGIRVSGPPGSVLYSPGVHSRFGRPRIVTGRR